MMRSVLMSLAALVFSATPLVAQRARSEQFYMPGRFNWEFLKRHTEAARLFNAFDYGHAVLYERLWTGHAGLPDELEVRQYEFLVNDLLRSPPRFAVAEEAVEPSYARSFWKAKLAFDWAHMLHRQIYDIYADPRLSPVKRDSLIEAVTDYYLSRNDVAFTAVPKSMALMEDQYFSKAFRERYPRFNGLIWAYHWLQVGLYEPLLSDASESGRSEGVARAVERFWRFTASPPDSFPRVMPMTISVAPKFAAAHPRAAAIFDNLHMMHDIISDILVSERVPRREKVSAVNAALAAFRDSTSNVMTVDEWREMGMMMGVAGMGGIAPAGDADQPAGESHRH